MNIADNIAAVKERLAQAAARSGRDAGDITLVGASKMNDAARVREAIAGGLAVCGENRVQELLEKNAQDAYAGAELHFIGHLQKNKAKNIVGLCSLIHSVDSVELMQEINRIALMRGITQDVLLEVNISGEASKYGFSPSELPSALESAGDFPALKVRGLMSVPPICPSGEDNLPYFLSLKQLFVDNGAKKYDNVRMDFLSMGMSDDFETAISCGSNMVRIGTAIFGPRNYPAQK